MPNIPRHPLPFPAYYDHARNVYLVEADHGWTQFVKEDLKLQMIEAGWNHDENVSLTELNIELLRLQRANKIDYAGPVAGFRCGIYTMNGMRVLITQSYVPVAVKQGEWKTIKRLVENLFSRIDHVQTEIFYSWCQVYLKSLKANASMPGQALFLAGPRGCGKSFLQNLLTMLFGGRSGNPWPYMSGETVFNSELFGKEHLMMEDPPVTKLKDRLEVGARIKQFTVTEQKSCHPKGRVMIMLPSRWRLTCSINDEPYNLRAIPPLDDSTADKISILRCHGDSVECRSSDLEVRSEFRKQIESELGAFAHFLLNEWEIPEKLRDGRYGVVHYHNPDILKEIEENSPEFDLLQTFDENNIFEHRGCWTGTSKQLANKLMEYVGDPDAIRFSKSSRSLSLKLASLAGKYPERVVYKPIRNKRLWIITKLPPAEG